MSKIYGRARPFVALDYRVAVLRDDDAKPNAAEEDMFVGAGCAVFAWQAGRALEDELFNSLPDDAVHALLEKAVEWCGDVMVDAQLSTASGNTLDLAACRGMVTAATRTAMATASKSKQNPWFKSVTAYEEVGRTIVGPSLQHADPNLRSIVRRLRLWLTSVG
nr:hypothetical protein [Nordella sp. HKS 07]